MSEENTRLRNSLRTSGLEVSSSESQILRVLRCQCEHFVLFLSFQVKNTEKMKHHIQTVQHTSLF